MAKSYIQRRSKKQEERVAEDVGGRTQAGSGSSWRAKGDVRDIGKLRAECKYTDNDFYILKLHDLRKIRDEARSGGLEEWVFQVEFALWKRCYAILGLSDFKHLRGLISLEDDQSLYVTGITTPSNSLRLKAAELYELFTSSASHNGTWCLHLRFELGSDQFGKPRGQENFAVIDWDEYLRLWNLAHAEGGTP